MIWLTWRQHRKQLWYTVGGLVALAALMVPTGVAMRNSFVHMGLAACLNPNDPATAGTEACGEALHQFSNRYEALSAVGVLFLVLPVLVGLFWGAPLIAREVEQGTHRLVWTQGVSRRHWALVKIGLVGGATLMLAVVYGFGISWWLWPLSQVQLSRFDVPFFDMQGLVPIGYTLFAVALGIFAGSVWPKVIAAMGVTLGGFVAVRIALTALARAHYLPAQVLTFPIRGPGPGPGTGIGDWVISSGVRDAAGNMVASNAEIVCPPNATGPGANCGAELGVTPTSYNWELYQPANRFWLFQSIETGIFVALALVLVYLAIRRVRRLA